MRSFPAPELTTDELDRWLIFAERSPHAWVVPTNLTRLQLADLTGRPVTAERFDIGTWTSILRQARRAMRLRDRQAVLV